MGNEEVIEQIREAFAATPYPGDAFLQGSFEGCEPFDEVRPFVGKTNWRELDATMLDARYSALSFFSEAGFRFFLPAFMIADLRDELLTADPLFHLSNGFITVVVQVPVGNQKFSRAAGGTKFVNPRRYGAMQTSDYARHRLSIFTREESKAIVTYLTYKREQDSQGLDRERIDAALKEFWLDRAENAPTQKEVEAYMREEERFTAALTRTREEIR
jgi:hypothetical protein